MGPSFNVPALLRSSRLWSLKHKRPVMAAEQIELMGYSLFDKSPCSMAKCLNALPEHTLRSLAGNGMQAAAIGTVLMFLLCGTELK